MTENKSGLFTTYAPLGILALMVISVLVLRVYFYEAHYHRMSQADIVLKRDIDVKVNYGDTNKNDVEGHYRTFMYELWQKSAFPEIKKGISLERIEVKYDEVTKEQYINKLKYDLEYQKSKILPYGETALEQMRQIIQQENQIKELEK